MLKILFTFIFTLLWGACLADMAPEALKVTRFSSLAFPKSLSKRKFQKILQAMMDKNYGIGFVDMGDISDLMHGHIIFEPVQKLADLFQTNNRILQREESKQFWDQLLPVGILFHTQEYPFLREGNPYLGPEGKIDYEKRNWLMFLNKNVTVNERPLINARTAMKPLTYPNRKVKTVYASSLRDDVFGFPTAGWDLAFYFFRVTCEQADEMSFAGDNLTEVNHKITGERICLVITSSHCRQHANDSKSCTGEEIQRFIKYQ